MYSIFFYFRNRYFPDIFLVLRFGKKSLSRKHEEKVEGTACEIFVFTTRYLLNISNPNFKTKFRNPSSQFPAKTVWGNSIQVPYDGRKVSKISTKSEREHKNEKSLAEFLGNTDALISNIAKLEQEWLDEGKIHGDSPVPYILEKCYIYIFCHNFRTAMN